MRLLPSGTIPRTLLFGGVLILITVAGSNFWLKKSFADTVFVPVPHCVNEKSMSFPCWKEKYERSTRELGVAASLVSMKAAYAHNSYVASQCHQLTHVVGNMSAEMHSADIAEAFTGGDAFCWSGYYHGVVERAVGLVGRDNIVAKLNSLCAKIPGKQSYSFDYYNCVHGLGHGLMSITRNELFESLALCDNLTDNWEQQSCQGGVFMENVMADNRNHFTKYLKKDDLTYPCNAVDEKYKQQCYLMQTSYMLTKNGYDFNDVFRRCADADLNYRNTCAESAGRDASGNSISDTKRTLATCGLALYDDQYQHCLEGAVKDFVSYFHDDKRAHELCAGAREKFRFGCQNTAESYYSTFK